MKYFARAKYEAIFKHSYYALLFGVTNPGLQITDRDYGTIGEATAWIENPYSVPTEFNDEYKVLAGTPETFSPNNYEVLYLS